MANIADFAIGLSIDGGDKVSAALKKVTDYLNNLMKLAPDLNLGLKGSDATVESITKIGNGLKDLSSLAGQTEDKLSSLQKAVPKASGPQPLTSTAGATSEKNNLFSPDFKKKMTDSKKDFKELFDAKPSDKTSKALKGLGDDLKGVSAMSFEAKAGIIAAMYAMEQLFSKSGQAGTSMTNFAALTGMDTKTLQQYQYAGRQVGITNEEMQGTFESLQAQMTKQLTGHGATAEFAQFAKKMGGITAADVKKFAEQPQLLLQKLQEYANKETNVGLRNQVLGSFVGKNVTSGLARNAFRPDQLEKAPVYSDKAIHALDQANIMWSNLGQRIQMAVGFLNAAHGGQIVADFGILVDIGIKLADVLLKIVERFHLFEGLQFILKQLSGVADSVVKVIGDMGDAIGAAFEKAHVFEAIQIYFKTLIGFVQKIIPLFGMLYGEFAKFVGQSHLLEHMIHIFDDIVSVITKVIAIVVKLAQHFEVFKKFGDFVSTMASGLESGLGAISGVLDKVLAVMDNMKSPADTAKEALSFMTGLPSLFGNFTDKLFGKNPPDKVPASAVAPAEAPAAAAAAAIPEPAAGSIEQEFQKLTLPGGEGGKPVLFEPKGAVLAPNLKLLVPPGTALPHASTWNPRVSTPISKSTAQNINVNQNMNFAHEGKNSKELGDSTKAAINHALRTSNATVQGS